MTENQAYNDQGPHPVVAAILMIFIIAATIGVVAVLTQGMLIAAEWFVNTV